MSLRGTYHDNASQVGSAPPALTGTRFDTRRKPTKSEEYVKVKGGYVSKSAYEGLGARDRQLLERVGVEEFNAIKAQEAKNAKEARDQQIAQFYADNVEVAGGYISAADFAKLSEEDQAFIKSYGVTAYNDQFTELPNGEYVRKDFYDTLSTEDKQYVDQHGVVAYNELFVKLDTGEYVRKEYLEELSADDRAYLMSHGVKAYSDLFVTLQNGDVIRKETYDSLSDDDRAYLNAHGINEFNTHFTATHHQLPSGEYITNEYWDSLQPTQQVRLVQLGSIEKWNEQLSRIETEINNMKASGYISDNNMVDIGRYIYDKGYTPDVLNTLMALGLKQEDCDKIYYAIKSAKEEADSWESDWEQSQINIETGEWKTMPAGIHAPPPQLTKIDPNKSVTLGMLQELGYADENGNISVAQFVMDYGPKAVPQLVALGVPEKEVTTLYNQGAKQLAEQKTTLSALKDDYEVADGQYDVAQAIVDKAITAKEATDLGFDPDSFENRVDVLTRLTGSKYDNKDGSFNVAQAVMDGYVTTKELGEAGFDDKAVTDQINDIKQWQADYDRVLDALKPFKSGDSYDLEAALKSNAVTPEDLQMIGYTDKELTAVFGKDWQYFNDPKKASGWAQSLWQGLTPWHEEYGHTAKDVVTNLGLYLTTRRDYLRREGYVTFTKEFLESGLSQAAPIVGIAALDIIAPPLGVAAACALGGYMAYDTSVNWSDRSLGENALSVGMTGIALLPAGMMLYRASSGPRISITNKVMSTISEGKLGGKVTNALKYTVSESEKAVLASREVDRAQVNLLRVAETFKGKLSSDINTVLASAKMQAAMQRVRVADGKFITAMGNVTSLTSDQLATLERLSHIRGLRNAILRLAETDRSLILEWDKLDNMKPGTEPYSKQLNNLQAARTSWQEAINVLNGKFDPLYYRNGNGVVPRATFRGFRGLIQSQKGQFKYDTVKKLAVDPESGKIVTLDTGRLVMNKGLPSLAPYESSVDLARWPVNYQPEAGIARKAGGWQRVTNKWKQQNVGVNPIKMKQRSVAEVWEDTFGPSSKDIEAYNLGASRQTGAGKSFLNLSADDAMRAFRNREISPQEFAEWQRFHSLGSQADVHEYLDMDAEKVLQAFRNREISPREFAEWKLAHPEEVKAMPELRELPEQGLIVKAIKITRPSKASLRQGVVEQLSVRFSASLSQLTNRMTPEQAQKILGDNADTDGLGVNAISGVAIRTGLSEHSATMLSNATLICVDTITNAISQTFSATTPQEITRIRTEAMAKVDQALQPLTHTLSQTLPQEQLAQRLKQEARQALAQAIGITVRVKLGQATEDAIKNEVQTRYNVKPKFGKIYPPGGETIGGEYVSADKLKGAKAFQQGFLTIAGEKKPVVYVYLRGRPKPLINIGEVHGIHVETGKGSAQRTMRSFGAGLEYPRSTDIGAFHVSVPSGRGGKLKYRVDRRTKASKPGISGMRG